MYKLSNINSRDIENAINFHDNLFEMIEEEDGEKPDDISLGTSEYFDKNDILEKRIEEENKIIDIFNKSLDVNDTEYNKIMSYSKLLSHDVDNNIESEEIKINETIEERENLETPKIYIEKSSNNNSNTNLYKYNEHYEKNEINDSQNDDIKINSTKHNQDTNTNRYKLYLSKENLPEKLEKVKVKINNIMKNVLNSYKESYKKQYISRLFQFRDINCIFSCMFFTLLIIFFFMNEWMGILLSILLFMISMQLKYALSNMVLLNSIIAIILISIATSFSYANINKNVIGNIVVGQNDNIIINANRNLLMLETCLCLFYALILFTYMISLRGITKYRQKHIWIYHNVITLFNFLDVCLIFSFGVLAFFFIFIALESNLLTIFSIILFVSSFLTYTLRSFSNILMLIIQTSLTITNLIIVSTSLPINHPINNKIIVNMQAQGTNKLLNNIYLFYMTYLIFFLALNLLYTFYVFFSNKIFLSRLFAQRKIYFSNVFPYPTKSFNECANGEIYFKQDKYILCLGDNNQILHAYKQNSKPVEIDIRKYMYNEFHFYKQLLLNTIIDSNNLTNEDINYAIKHNANEGNNNHYSNYQKQKNFKNKTSKYNNNGNRDVVLDVIDTSSDMSSNSLSIAGEPEIIKNKHVSSCNNNNTNSYKNIIKKNSRLLLKKVTNIQDEKLYKNKRKGNKTLNNYYYLTNCEYSNSDSNSLFYSKYSHIIGVLVKNYDDLIYYLNKKKILNKLIDSESEINNTNAKTNDKGFNNLGENKSNELSMSSELKIDTNILNDEAISNCSNIKKNETKSNSQMNDMHNISKSIDNITPSYKSEFDSNNLSNQIFMGTLEKENDSSFYWINKKKNFNKSNSIFTNCTNEYFNIPIYSASPNISPDKCNKMDENYFWYYYPGIIDRVYNEWLTCKNLDCKKFNNDFYHLLKNSNEIQKYFYQSNSIEKQGDIKLFDITQVLSNNINIINKIVQPYSPLKSSSLLSGDLLPNNNNGNSLNGIINNFLEDINIDGDDICYFDISNMQFFIEDNNNNINLFLSSLAHNHRIHKLLNNHIPINSSDILQSLIKEIDEYTQENKKNTNSYYQYNNKINDNAKFLFNDYTYNDLEKKGTHILDENKENSIILNNSYGYKNKSNNIKNYNINNNNNIDAIIENWKFNKIGDINILKNNNFKFNGFNLQDADGTLIQDKYKSNSENINFNDLLKYAETLIIQNTGNEFMKESFADALSSNLYYESEIELINNFDEILSNFIKNVQTEKVNSLSSSNLMDNKQNYEVGAYSNTRKSAYKENISNIIDGSNNNEQFYQSLNIQTLQTNKSDSMTKNKKCTDILDNIISESNMSNKGMYTTKELTDVKKLNIREILTSPSKLDEFTIPKTKTKDSIECLKKENKKIKELTELPYNSLKEYIDNDPISEKKQTSNHNLLFESCFNLSSSIKETKHNNEHVLSSYGNVKDEKDKNKLKEKEGEETDEIKNLYNSIKDTKFMKKTNINKNKSNERNHSNCYSSSNHKHHKKNGKKENNFVENFCIYSNNINYDSKKKTQGKHDEHKQIIIDQYDDDNYEKEYGYNSEYIKRIEEKNYSTKNISNDNISNSNNYNIDNYDLIKNLKKYLSSSSNIGIDDNEFNDTFLLDYINKYLENNNSYNINIYNEVVINRNNNKRENAEETEVDKIKHTYNTSEFIHKLKQNNNDKQYIKKKNTFLKKIDLFSSFNEKNNLSKYYDTYDGSKLFKELDKKINKENAFFSNLYNNNSTNFLNMSILKSNYSNSNSCDNNFLNKTDLLKNWSYNTKLMNVNVKTNEKKHDTSNIYNVKKLNTLEKIKEDIMNYIPIKLTNLKKNENHTNLEKNISKTKMNNPVSCIGSLSNKYDNLYSNINEENNSLFLSKDKKVSNNLFTTNEQDENTIKYKQNMQNITNGNDDIYHSIYDLENSNKNNNIENSVFELINNENHSQEYQKNQMSQEIIKKPNINLMISNSPNSIRNLGHQTSPKISNILNDSKTINIDKNDILDNKNKIKIYQPNKNIFNDVYGFRNKISETNSSTENDLTELLAGSDVFYESFKYKSDENIDDLKKYTHLELYNNEENEKKKITFNNVNDNNNNFISYEIKDNSNITQSPDAKNNINIQSNKEKEITKGNKNTEKLNDTSILSLSGKYYLTHQNIYNEKSNSRNRSTSTNSFFLKNNNSFENKNYPDSEKKILHNFFKNSNTHKHSNDFEIKNGQSIKLIKENDETLDKQIDEILNKLNSQNEIDNQLKNATKKNTNSNDSSKSDSSSKSENNSNKSSTSKNQSKSESNSNDSANAFGNVKKKKTSNNKQNQLKRSDHSEKNTYKNNEMMISGFLKKNRYNFSSEENEKEEKMKIKNRYYNKCRIIKNEKNDNKHIINSFNNSYYIQHFNNIISTYSWCPNSIDLEKNEYSLKKDNIYMDTGSTEDSDVSDTSNFVNDVIHQDSNSSMSSNASEYFENRSLTKWESQKSLKNLLKNEKKIENNQISEYEDSIKHVEINTNESFIELIKQGSIFPSIKINPSTNENNEGNNKHVSNDQIYNQYKNKLEIFNSEKCSNASKHALNSSTLSYISKENNKQDIFLNTPQNNISKYDIQVFTDDGINDEYNNQKWDEVNNEVNQEINKKNYIKNKHVKNQEYKITNLNELKSVSYNSSYQNSNINDTQRNNKINSIFYHDQNDSSFYSNNSDELKSSNIGINSMDIYKLPKNLVSNIDSYNVYKNSSLSNIPFNEFEKNDIAVQNAISQYQTVNVNPTILFESKYIENVFNTHENTPSEGLKKINLQTKKNLAKQFPINQINNNNNCGIISSSRHSSIDIYQEPQNTKTYNLNNKYKSEKKEIPKTQIRNTHEKKPNYIKRENNSVVTDIQNDRKKMFIEELKKKLLEKKNVKSTNSIKISKENKKYNNIDAKKDTHYNSNLKNYKKKKNENIRKMNSESIEKKTKHMSTLQDIGKIPYSANNFCNIINSDDDIDQNMFVNMGSK
ncbi:conserved Plasmodium protein, unknown function [Plasmodium berghei]|uniref:Uncharacterized protein n=1 Tax=Plasmodium berghei TaxID=5821 RepID=A0A1D3S7C1_PLABE|nr:conserved Plasmodium protein, unknown function [Plasmodium berghei]